MYRNLVVALSGTDDSSRVLAHTTELAKATGARVRVLHVRAVDCVEPTTMGLVPSAPALVREENGTAQDVVDRAVGELTAAGVDAQGDIVEAMRAEVASTVCELAEAGGADLIVVGEHQGGLLTALVGSTGERVARLCSVPVLLVP
ncbi:universal stress protein [Actinocatenispora thailandica]|uniref:Universal stress protein n=1 Tax=Actinocatenispora thailandica TaxID=227318 RepID=A0A7R7DT52_9ACTN|nr:universal stress protein [Actinocatenispora thailandica]BCJ37333.1 universal stress protein [Actinocatenispora thailandica]